MKRNHYKIIVYIALALLIAIPMIGLSSWAVINDFLVKPKYNPNSAFYIYLQGQSATYDGSGKMPNIEEFKKQYLDLNGNGKVNDDGIEVNWKYRKLDESTSSYSNVNAKPTDADTYLFYFWCSIDEVDGKDGLTPETLKKLEEELRFIPTEVLYTINPAKPTITTPTFKTAVLYSPNIYQTINKSEFSAKGIDNEIISGNFTITQGNVDNDFEGITTLNGHKLIIHYSFQSSNTNYNNYSGTITYPLISVCASGSNYYSRIESALTLLTNNTSNTIKTLNLTDKMPVIYDNCTIEANDKLIIAAFKNDGTYISSSYNATICSNGINYYENNETKKTGGSTITDVDSSPNTILINNNVVLNNYGVLEIGGTLAAGPNNGYRAGHTSQNYAIIYMGKNSTINSHVGSTINCYGFIWESCSGKCSNKPYVDNTCANEGCVNNNSILNIEGLLYIPFVVRDMTDGNYLTASYKALTGNPSSKSAPFNDFIFENITCKVYLKNKSSVKGWASIYAWSLKKFYSIEEVFLLSVNAADDNNYVLEVTSNDGYVEVKYSAIDETIKLIIYGDSNTNALKLEFDSYTVDTNQAYFPISWRYDITFRQVEGILKKAKITLGQKYKLMPGAKVTLSKGTETTIDELISYETFSDENGAGRYKYPTKYTVGFKKGQAILPGNLIVNGNLTVTTCLSSKISSTVVNASINFSSPLASTSATSKEIKTIKSQSFLSSVTAWQEIETNLSLQGISELYSTVNEYKTCSFTYEDSTDGQTYYCWYVDIGDGTLTYDTKGGNTITSSALSNVGAGYNLQTLELIIPSKNHYTFGGWYADEGLTIHVSENVNGEWKFKDYYIFESTTLYAKWTPIEYTLIYNLLDDDGKDVTDTYIDQNNISVNANNFPYNLTEPSRDGYIFDGWYTVENFTSNVGKIEKLESSFDPNLIQNNNINVYAKWVAVSGVAVKFTTGIGSAIGSDEFDVGETMTLPGANSTTATGHTLSGWLCSHDNEVYAPGASYNVPDTSNITFTAQWEVNEYTITFNTNGGSSVAAIKQDYGSAITAPSNPTRTNYRFDGWDKTIPSTMPAENITITAKWVRQYTITFNANGGSSISSITQDTGSIVTLPDAPTRSDHEFTYWTDTNNNQYTAKQSIVLTSDLTLTAQWKSTGGGFPCVTSDTLITLADGTQVRIDELKGNESLLVWDHVTGSYTSAKIAYIVCHDDIDVEHKVTKLHFSDGSYIEIIGEHVFFDSTLNKYVAIDEFNVNNYIGHNFLKQGDNKLEIITLVSSETYSRATRSYEVVTDKHLINFTNGILSTSAYLDPLLNVFDLIDNYQYDLVQMQEDIETYGLYTYEDFEGLIAEEAFEMYNAKYLKVAVGKGYITWEDILLLIDIYYDVDVNPL